MRKLLSGGLGSLALMVSAAAAVLAASLVSNGSFETGTDPGGFTQLSAGSTAITDWVIKSGTIDYIGTYWQAEDGDRSIDLTGTTPGAISQELTTVPGTVYRVSFAISGNPAGGSALKEMEVDTGGTPTLFTYDTSAAGNTLADMKWEEKSFEFTATDTTTILTFTSLNSGHFGPALDNVVVEQLLPMTKDECKQDGWMDFGVFKNQGDCVSYVATGGSNLPAGE